MRAFTIDEVAYCNRVSEAADPAAADLVRKVLELIAIESDNPTSSLIGMAMGLCIQGMKPDQEVLRYCAEMQIEIRRRMFALLKERKELEAQKETGT